MYVPWLISVVVLAVRAHEPTEINIGALFDLERLPGRNGHEELRAAQVAVQDINAQSDDLFGGLYTLRLLSNNSRVAQEQHVELVGASLIALV